MSTLCDSLADMLADFSGPPRCFSGLGAAEDFCVVAGDQGFFRRQNMEEMPVGMIDDVVKVSLLFFYCMGKKDVSGNEQAEFAAE